MKRKIVVMGVAGSGKSSVGSALASLLGARFIDADDLHPPANVVKMSGGTPLTDEDRWPWLEKVGSALLRDQGTCIVACSALRRIYRDCIRDVAGEDVLFVFLSGERRVIERRMQDRSDHFMPASLLESQFEALEPPRDDEVHVEIDIACTIRETVNLIDQFLKSGTS
ncbi:gluconokinase [Algicella marina]|uniref:Gluconokinase n=1 Tax=Algicella marina TaxID=2683284 RepID=A0A6P1T0V3_9RHOB|nr:gluconokinase [Algicella marina]QHQ35273.1 gluconokinase [Algicella marina]